MKKLKNLEKKAMQIAKVNEIDYSTFLKENLKNELRAFDCLNELYTEILNSLLAENKVCNFEISKFETKSGKTETYRINL